MIEALINMDYSLFQAINTGWSNPIFDVVLVAWRNANVWIPLYVFFICFVLFNYGKEGYWILLFTILTVTTSDMVSSRLIKPWIERPRPCHGYIDIEVVERIRCGVAFSFPSSHATNHFAIGMFVFFVFGTAMSKWRWLLPLWAGVVGLSQIYVGVHFPVDVLGGSILGIFIGYLWAYLFNKYYRDRVFSRV